MEDMLFIYARPYNSIHPSYQETVGRAVADYLQMNSTTYNDSKSGPQYMLGKILSLSTERRIRNLYVYDASVISNSIVLAWQYIEHLRKNDVQIIMGTGVLPKTERFSHIHNPDYLS